MISIDDLDDDVLEAIANNMALDTGEESSRLKIERLSPEEAFDKFLNWHGIIGYTSLLTRALDNIRSAKGIA